MDSPIAFISHCSLWCSMLMVCSSEVVDCEREFILQCPSIFLCFFLNCRWWQKPPVLKLRIISRAVPQGRHQCWPNSLTFRVHFICLGCGWYIIDIFFVFFLLRWPFLQPWFPSCAVSTEDGEHHNILPLFSAGRDVRQAVHEGSPTNCIVCTLTQTDNWTIMSKVERFILFVNRLASILVTSITSEVCCKWRHAGHKESTLCIHHLLPHPPELPFTGTKIELSGDSGRIYWI